MDCVTDGATVGMPYNETYTISVEQASIIICTLNDNIMCIGSEDELMGEQSSVIDVSEEEQSSGNKFKPQGYACRNVL